MQKLDDALLTVVEALGNLDREMVEGLDELDVEQLAEFLVKLHMVKGSLADSYSYVETELAGDMAAEEPLAAGGKTVTKKVSSASVKWDTPSLKSVVTERIMFNALDPDTGAIDAPVSQLISEALECVGINYWKVGNLKAIGVNPDLYREKSGVSTRIAIT